MTKNAIMKRCQKLDRALPHPFPKAGEGKKTRGGVGANELVNRELLSGFMKKLFVKGNFQKYMHLFCFVTPMPRRKSISKRRAGQGGVDGARKDGVEHVRGGSAYSSKYFKYPSSILLNV